MTWPFGLTCGFCPRPAAALLALSAIWSGGLFAARAQEAADKKPAQWITPAAEQAIDKGLDWLAAHQQDDGSFGSGPYRGNVAISGLAGLALIAGGSAPGRGPHGQRIERCVDFLLANTQQSGYIVYSSGAGHGPMYGQGFATLFLAECHGMSARAELREKLGSAVKLICSAQNKQGGWRYEPRPADADISVTVCQVMALRAAKNAGIDVPGKTIDQAIDYVKRCQNPDGGFMYQLETGGESDFPRSAAAVVALNSAGIYQGPEIDKGVAYLMQFLPQPGVARRDPNQAYYEYGHYYAVQAMWHAGGKQWARWYPAIRDELVSRQRSDGSWSSTFGPEYGTAMCLLVLQVPNDALPIFQR